MASRFANSTLSRVIFAVALFGVLVVTHLGFQQAADFAAGCTGFGDLSGGPLEAEPGCAAVTTSAYADFLGVSNIFWGLLFYVGLALLRLAYAVTAREPLRLASFALAGAGLLYTLYLVYLQAAVIGAFCPLCMTSALTVLVLFVLHVLEHRRAPTTEPAPKGKKAAPARPASAALRPFAVIAGVFAVLLVADVVIAGNVLDEAAPTGVAADGTLIREAADGAVDGCTLDAERPTFGAFETFVGGRTAFEGSPSAPARALKVFDPNCPHCKTLHDVMEEAPASVAEDVRIYYQPWAIWGISVPHVQALYLAREHGNEAFLAMMDRQFEGQRTGGLPVDTLVAYAAEIGLDPEAFRRDMEAQKYVGMIQQESQMLSGSGITSVPKLIFEGEVMASTNEAMRPECVTYFAERAAERRGS